MAGSIRLTDFKNQIQDVARPNRFWISFRGGYANSWLDSNMSYAAKSTSLPGRTLGQIELAWQGMKTKIAGDPTFDDISLTFINSYEWNVRNFFEGWIQNIANMNTNNRLAHVDYKCEMVLQQLGRTDMDILAEYVLEGAYPTSMDAVDLSYDSNDTAQEFNVSITYDTYYRLDPIGQSIAPPSA